MESISLIKTEPEQEQIVESKQKIAKISVLMPCLNEEQTIGACIQFSFDSLKDYLIPFEIVISDNGSVDKSPEIARSLGAKVIHTKAKGYGNAYRNGFNNVSGKYVVMFDSDLTYDPADIPRFIKTLKTTNADIVIGTRLHGKIEKGAMPWLHRYIGNPFLTFMLNKLFGAKYLDSHCGMRAFKVDSFKKLNLASSGMEFASEMLVKATLHDMKVVQIPITYRSRPNGSESKLHSFDDGFRHVKFLSKSWFNFKIKKAKF